MLTAAGCRQRRERLWQVLPMQPAGILITDPKHLVYLANYWQSPFAFRSNDAGAVLLLTPDGRSVLIADNLLEPFLAQAHVDEVVAPVWYRSVEPAPRREVFLARSVQDQLQRRGLTDALLATEHSRLPLAMRQGLRPPVESGINLDPILAELRRRKDPDELDLIRLSVKAGEAGMAAAWREAKPGMTEMELYWAIQRAACEAIGMQAIVYGDFVCGVNTEKGGGLPSQRRIVAGDLVLVDFSVVIWHYRSDFAMTFVCDGKPTSKQQEMHQACLAAIAAGEEMLRPGVLGGEVYQAVRGVFSARQLQDHFPHHAGHGIGLSHPEAPFLVPQSQEELLASDVVTLEPGLYITGVGGIRIERNYLITEGGSETLSHHCLGLEQKR